MKEIKREIERKKKKKKGDIVKVQITKAYQQSQGVQLFFFLCASFDMPVPKFVLPCGYTSWTRFFVNIVKVIANSCAAYELGMNFYKLKAMRRWGEGGG